MPFQVPKSAARPLALLIAINILVPMVYYELISGFYVLWGDGRSEEAYIKAGYVVSTLTLGVFFLLQYLNVRVALAHDGFRTVVYALLLLNLLCFMPFFDLSVFFRLQSMFVKGMITLLFVDRF